MAKLSLNTKYLRNLLVVYIIADIFLTPIGGLETRPASDVTVLGFATVGLLFVGLALNAISLALIFRRRGHPTIIPIIGSALYFPAAIADQAGLFSTLGPPLGISYLEAVEAVVALAVITLAVRVRRESPQAPKTSSATTG